MAKIALVRLSQIPGLSGRFNDLILSRAKFQASSSLILFFHGDIQDYPEVMAADQERKKYHRWNLENTASILAQKFADSVIMVVKAARMRSGTKACFDHFVETDLCGNPTFILDTQPLAHLKLLIDQTIERQSSWFSPFTCIRLIGFSQGMVVTNQLIHSIFRLNESPDPNLEPLVSVIKHIYWLDGGQCWLTQEPIISTLKQRNIYGHVHVTPLQVANPDRPQNQINYKIFISQLDALQINHVHRLHYSDQEPSFDDHFRLLTDFDP